MKFVVVYAERSVRLFEHATLKHSSPPVLQTVQINTLANLPRVYQRTWAWRCVQNPRFTHNACLRDRKYAVHFLLYAKLFQTVQRASNTLCHLHD